MKDKLMIDSLFTDTLLSGGVVAFPTETVYGLGADAANLEAIKKIYELKGRPADNPLIVHIAELSQWSSFASEITDDALKLARAFWPGPLAIILKKKPEVLDVITAGLDSVAVRMPDHPLALELIKKTMPLAAPSANLSGRPSPTKAAHVEADFGHSVLVLDGGRTKVGLESTVIDLSSGRPVILRPGFIGKEDIEQVLGKSVFYASGSTPGQTPRSPGQKYSHYKPEAQVSWLKTETPGRFEENTLYLMQYASAAGKNVITYGGNLTLMARELYDRFRQADTDGFSKIKVAPLAAFTGQAVYPALINRINKAAGQG